MGRPRSCSRRDRRGRLLLLALACPLACASSVEGSFTGASSLSAGNSNGGSATASDSDGESGDPTTSASGTTTTGGSASDSDSASGTTQGTTDEPTSTTDELTSTTDEATDTQTTGLDCDDGLGLSCDAPYDFGSVSQGQSMKSQTSTIIALGTADWFKVSFPAVNRPGGGTPTVHFLENDDEAYRFDVLRDPPCDPNPFACGDGGEDNLATGLLEYTFTDDQPDCCSPPDDSLVPWPGVLYLRVYREDEGETCATYQLEIRR